MTIKLKKNCKNILIAAAAAVLFPAVSSCSSTQAQVPQQQPVNNQQIQQLEDKMFANEKPENHFDEIRDYVYEQYPDLPSDVELLVKNTKPKAVYNKSKMEYCFFWVLTDGSILEVITTPPPLCDPIAIHHGKRIQYE